MSIFKQLKAQRVNMAGAVSVAVFCGLLASAYAFAQGGPATSVPPDVENTIMSGGDYYKLEGGVVYEWDDGAWEAEHDKKIENGIVYELEHGVWVREDYPVQAPAEQPAPQENTIISGDDIYKLEDGVVYEWDDGVWEAEHDKKIENGIVYELEHGVWVREDADEDDHDDYDDYDFDDEDEDD